MTHRRGNGLLADTYVPLIVLPPALADLMLDALRRSGIAAYAVPLDNVLESADALDDPPTDHLHVDARQRAAAAEILRAELPDLEQHRSERGAAAADSGGAAGGGEPAEAGPGPAAADPARDTADDDDVWADLVARFYDDGRAGDAPHWPDAENLSAGERSGADGGRGRVPDPGDLLDTREPEPDPEPDDEPRARLIRPAETTDPQDHYVPPPPPPLPRGDLVSRLSWGGLFGGPLVLLGSMLLGVSLPGWVAFLAVAAFIAGFVVLVVRMGDRPPGDQGPDDGAVV
ncbi:hypothetical protein ACFPZ0_15535 [Streptomonospora nanhaiensis]|uniref:DUF308 domain-containing protein n=1 Tax=Streptomonospora nanhaiensis TaxID=1323731 RepID=A0A853BK39_9ACTN|nr:hypothetical protein [Streptomonospora nanhaiensis]MBV2362412.1 hypothetical protein [Streptomonospora nanhaiensis]MBX9389129.1 hypothetical protein [Streptomonospora nanhaiensis]NYI94931.1 hypothetical protein [Streptomonospora nanhaiensis]